MSRFTDLFQEPAPSLKPGFNENTTDRDGGGVVQDETKFERPSLTSKSPKTKTPLK